MNSTGILKVLADMHKCLHCGAYTEADQPFCSDKCKSDDYLDGENK